MKSQLQQKNHHSNFPPRAASTEQRSPQPLTDAGDEYQSEATCLSSSRATTTTTRSAISPLAASDAHVRIKLSGGVAGFPGTNLTSLLVRISRLSFKMKRPRSVLLWRYDVLNIATTCSVDINLQQLRACVRACLSQHEQAPVTATRSR